MNFRIGGSRATHNALPIHAARHRAYHSQIVRDEQQVQYDQAR
ncbi:hypothetical protein [Burkholderia sp. LMG 32019]